MRIGLYGGTFSPPHKAHVRAAKLFCTSVDLDKLYVMPAGDPPHKEQDQWGCADARLQMTIKAFSSFAEVSDYEIRKKGKSYTVETLRHLKKIHPNDELYMLLGEDMFFSFCKWYAPDEISSLCTLVAMRRTDTPIEVMEMKAAEYKESYGAKTVLIDADPMELSSTEIRKRIATENKADSLIPRTVAEYINKNGLYRYDN